MNAVMAMSTPQAPGGERDQSQLLRSLMSWITAALVVLAAAAPCIWPSVTEAPTDTAGARTAPPTVVEQT